MPLIRLLYRSRNRLALPLRRLIKPVSDIMSVSIRRNRASNITGSLIYDESWFVQILEGEDKLVRDTYDRIMTDHRHDDCIVIAAERADERLFDYWWSAPIPAEISHRDGFDPAHVTPGDLIALVRNAAIARPPALLMPV